MTRDSIYRVMYVVVTRKPETETGSKRIQGRIGKGGDWLLKKMNIYMV